MTDRQTERILAFSSPDRSGSLVMTAQRKKGTENENKTKQTNKRRTGGGQTQTNGEKAFNLTSCPPGRFWDR